MIACLSNDCRIALLLAVTIFQHAIASLRSQ